MNLDDLHRTHARHLYAARRAPGTVGYYRDCVNRLKEFMASEGLPDDADALDRQALIRFMLWLRERGLAPGGEAAVMRGVRATLRFAEEEELVAGHPTHRLKLGSVPQPRPPAVSDHEAREAIRIVAGLRHPLRDRAILTVMLDTGVRMGELLALRTGDVDTVGGMIRLRAETTKRRRERRIPVGIKSGRAIAAYERRERKPARPGVETLFLNRSGLPMTPSALHNLLWRVADQAQIPRSHLSPHAWRRAFATSYLRHGGDLATLQQLMGHATIAQTQIYLRITTEDLQRAHLCASPMDRL